MKQSKASTAKAENLKRKAKTQGLKDLIDRVSASSLSQKDKSAVYRLCSKEIERILYGAAVYLKDWTPL